MILVIFVVGGLSSLGEATCSDYENSWAKKEITYMMEKNIIAGYPDKSFKPENNMKRVEFYKIINNLIGFSNKSKVEFEDVKPTDWYYDEIVKGLGAKYIDKSKSLNPKANISREEVAKIIGKVYNIEKDDAFAEDFLDGKSLSKSLKGIVGGLKKKGFIAGYPDKTFKSKGEITRAEVVKILYDASGEIINKPGEVKTDVKTNLLVNVGDVKLKNMIIQGDLYLTPGIGEGDVSLDNVEVKGEIFIKGGGPNSIVIKNSKLNRLLVDKELGSVRVVIENTKVNKIAAFKEAKIELINKTKIQLVDLDGKTDLRLEKGTSITNLNSSTSDATIDCKGTIESVEARKKIKINGEIVKKNNETKVKEGKIIKELSKFEKTDELKNTNKKKTKKSKENTTSEKLDSVILVRDINIIAKDKLVKGEILQLDVNIKPSNSTNKKVKWSIVSGPGTIDENGLLRAITIGKIKVKALAKDGSGIEEIKEITVSLTQPEKDDKETESKIEVTSVNISGDDRVGEELKAKIEPINAEVRYQWKVSDTVDGDYVDIEGATENIYIPKEEDKGKFLKVQVEGIGVYTGIQENISGRIYVLANDNHFEGRNNGEFKYIGSDQYVEIPSEIKGTPLTSYEKMFEGNKKVGEDSIKGIKSTNENITNMSYMFFQSKADSLDLSNFDTSNVTNMNGMFRESYAVSLNISNFNTSNVKDMSYMFFQSKADSLDLSNFDTSKVTNMNGMFNKSQIKLLDISKFDTSNVINMEKMFSSSKTTSLDLSNFNTSSVTNMKSMFSSSKATSLDLSSFDTSKVTDMEMMFYNSNVTTVYTRTQEDRDRLNASSNKPTNLNFIIKAQKKWNFTNLNEKQTLLLKVLTKKSNSDSESIEVELKLANTEIQGEYEFVLLKDEQNIKGLAKVSQGKLEKILEILNIQGGQLQASIERKDKGKYKVIAKNIDDGDIGISLKEINLSILLENELLIDEGTYLLERSL